MRAAIRCKPRRWAWNRTTGAYGPEITDPSCYYDIATQRSFLVVLTLDRVGTTHFLSGANHLDIAVSQTASPLGAFNIYRLPVQDDGTQGTPNHMCTGGPCLGDYPHLGADASGFYLTTNEFNFAAPGFRGSQIYAMSKRALASGAASIGVTQFDTANHLLGGARTHGVACCVAGCGRRDGWGHGILPEFGGGIQLYASGQPFEGVDAEKDRVAGRSEPESVSG